MDRTPSPPGPSSLGISPSGSLGPADSGRLDPALRRLVSDPGGRPPSDLNVWKDFSGRRWVSALLVATHGADPGPLSDLGVRINSLGSPENPAVPGVRFQRPNGVISAEVPIDQLARLSGWVSLEYAEAARHSHYLLDQSIPEIHADAAHRVYQRRGRGVLVGLVDSGIDLRHLDFRKANGQTRIRYVWDQTDTIGPSPVDYPFGREYTGAEIDGALLNGTDLPEKDGDPRNGGHGTHVAGIAAGGGGGTPFQGVAPDADLIVVKWDGIHGLDANRYLMSRAAALHMPVVINNSWGGQSGPHDGTDAESMGLSALVGKGLAGQAICFAAGNSGDQAIHISGAPYAGSTSDVSLIEPNGQDEFEIEIWADAKSTFQFGLTFPDTLATRHRSIYSITSGDPNVEKWNVPATSDEPYGGAHVSLDARDRPYPLNPTIQRCTLHVDLRDTSGGTLTGLPWCLFIHRLDGTGSGRFDGWVTLGDRLQFDTTGGSLKGNAFKTLVNQACIPDGIAIGAYVSKTSWTAWNNVAVTDPLVQGNPGDPSTFSSEGPARDGGLKPDCSAPGQWVASSLSGDISLPLSQQQYVTPDGSHLLLEGTSMASPHVAGTIALLLQANPALDAVQIRDLIRAGIDSDAGWTPSEGFGRINAFQSLRRAVIQQPQLPGDLNGDGHVDILDTVLALKMVLGLIAPLSGEIGIADVSPPSSAGRPAGDGRLSLSDVIRLLRRSLNLETNPWP